MRGVLAIINCASQCSSRAVRFTRFSRPPCAQHECSMKQHRSRQLSNIKIGWSDKPAANFQTCEPRPVALALWSQFAWKQHQKMHHRFDAPELNKNHITTAVKTQGCVHNTKKVNEKPHSSFQIVFVLSNHKFCVCLSFLDQKAFGSTVK